MIINAIFLFTSLCIFIAFLILPGKSTDVQRASIEGHNCAHRGLHSGGSTIPENSIAAFTAAIDASYGIELDIQLSKDGYIVVFHDDTLKRVCGINRRVDEFTLSELHEMRLFDSEEKIPLFSEVLDLVNGRVPLIIELKIHLSRNRELCAKAYALLRKYNGPFCVESFDPRIVRWFMQNAPGVLRGQLSSSMQSFSCDIASAAFDVTRLIKLLLFAVSGLYTNFLSRPQFIAYRTCKKPFTVKLAQHFAMKIAWTVRPDDNIEKIENENDAVIFEYYTPEPKFKT